MWNEALLGATDHNPFQSVEWGELNRPRWRPLRFLASNRGGRTVGMVQILQRSVGPMSIGWAPGGPVLGFGEENIGAAVGALPQAFSGTSLKAVRFDCYMPRQGLISYDFHRFLKPAFIKVNSGFTSWIDLHSLTNHMESRWGSDHRRILRRAKEAGVTVRAQPGGGQKDFLSVYNDMRSTKGMRSLPDLRQVTTRIHELFGDDAIAMTAYYEDQAISTALLLRSGNSATYVAGGTSKTGRRVGGGHVLFDELLTELPRRGIDRFDLGGLDPRPQNQGVDRFKLGLGGAIHERVGEWDWATGPLTRAGLNVGVSLRRSKD